MITLNNDFIYESLEDKIEHYEDFIISEYGDLLYTLDEIIDNDSLKPSWLLEKENKCLNYTKEHNITLFEILEEDYFNAWVSAHKHKQEFIKDHVKLPNAKKYTSNKSFRYDLYTIGQLESKYDKFDNKDFLYANTIEDIQLSNGIDEIKLTKRTITGGLNKMCDLNIPTIRKEKLQGNKTVYIMNDGIKESYLSVPRDQALELAFLGDTVIKLLVIFNTCLYNHTSPRRISQEYLIESLGMSISGQNRKKVASAIDMLYKLGYITKYEEQNPHIPTDVCYSYTLNTYEQWKEKSKPIKLNRGGKA